MLEVTEQLQLVLSMPLNLGKKITLLDMKHTYVFINICTVVTLVDLLSPVWA